MTSNESPPQVQASISEQRRSWQSMFSTLGISNFRKYWICLLVLTFANQLQIPAQSWLSYELTHSPLMLTLVMAMQSVPMLVLSLYSGVIVDRVQKRSVLVVTNLVTATLAIVIALLIATEMIRYWHLLAVSFVTGINGAFNLTARNSIVAELVPRERLYNAIALGTTGSYFAAVVGPATAGLLIGFIGTHGAYYCGAGFCLAGVVLAAMLPATSKVGKTAVSMIKNMTEGLRYLRSKRTIIILLVMELALTLFGMCYTGLMPVFAEVLNVESEGYGFLLAASGIGSMLASLAIAALGNFKKKGLVLLVTGIIFGITLVLFANSANLGEMFNLGSGSYYLALVLLVAVGVFSIGYIVTSSTIIQLNVSDEYRGRVTSVYSLVVSLYPVSTLGAGAIAESLGAPAALSLAGGALALFMLLMFIFSSRIRRLE